jgi:catechol 2,3-dioxygenase-like lactoylglutathione lyase family enzyme
MRIGLTSIFVDDQDQAERFYTEVLGFQVKTSAPYGPEERWLSVVAPEEPDGVELVLHLTDEPARAFQAASRQVGRPVLSLRTDDCAAEAEIIPLGRRAAWRSQEAAAAGAPWSARCCCQPPWRSWGDRAWWLPGWLGWLPQLTIEPPATSGPGAPAPAAEPGPEAGVWSS